MDFGGKQSTAWIQFYNIFQLYYLRQATDSFGLGSLSSKYRYWFISPLKGVLSSEWGEVCLISRIQSSVSDVKDLLFPSYYYSKQHIGSMNSKTLSL